MGKTVIIGGVAGGASCAARLRRLDGDRDIIILERGEYISYANCGLPYHVGDVIRSRRALLLMTPQRMKERFNIEVRTKNEVTAIDRAAKLVRVKDLATGREYEETYDDLVIATGSSPLRPRIPGIDSDRIRTLWTVPDTDEIRRMVQEEGITSAAVIGGGFIGLEMAENLRHAGLKVTIIEALDQVMAPLDFEMAQLLHENIRDNGVDLRLADAVESFEETMVQAKAGETAPGPVPAASTQVTVRLKSGAAVTADLVILSIGVRPNSALAKEAGLPLNQRGGIIVDEHLRTEDSHIYAVGDVVEVEDFVFGDRTMVPLAGPANKQGRIAADNLAGGDAVYRGTQGSSVAKVFDLTAASTGASEKTLIRRGLAKNTDYRSLIITQNSHAGYYPGATPMTMKLLFSMDGKKIYGAQIVGRDGVDKRIDVLGTAMRLGAGVQQLKELELAYAPPYSSAKDPVNMAGFVAENLMKGLVDIAEYNEPDTDPEAVMLDVREEAELLGYAVPGAVNVPLGQLRDRLGELDPEKRYIVLCAVGVRAYNGARILMQHGFKNVKIYPGGVRFYAANHPQVKAEESAAPAAEEKKEELAPGQPSAGRTEPRKAAALQAGEGNIAAERSAPMEQPKKNIKKVRLDCSGMQCPGPIMEVFKSMKELKEGEMVEVTASDPGFAKDIVSWCRRTGNTLVSNEKKNGEYVAVISRGIAAAAGESAPAGLAPGTPVGPALAGIGSAAAPPKGKTIIVFDGDMDKVLASFVIANGALAMGRPVTMFFTFWGLNARRKTRKVPVKKNSVEKMFGAMLPRGSKKLKLSKMNMAGMGTAMMRRIMKDKNIDSLEDMMKKAMENGVKIIACSMSMDVMGIRPEELIDGVEIGGVGTYLGDAEESDVNLFI